MAMKIWVDVPIPEREDGLVLEITMDSQGDVNFYKNNSNGTNIDIYLDGTFVKNLNTSNTGYQNLCNCPSGTHTLQIKPHDGNYVSYLSAMVGQVLTSGNNNTIAGPSNIVIKCAYLDAWRYPLNNMLYLDAAFANWWRLSKIEYLNWGTLEQETSFGDYFMQNTFYNCYDLQGLPEGFNLLQNVTYSGNNNFKNTFLNCTSLSSSSPTTTIRFPVAGTNTFSGTSISPTSPSAGTTYNIHSFSIG